MTFHPMQWLADSVCYPFLHADWPADLAFQRTEEERWFDDLRRERSNREKEALARLTEIERSPQPQTFRQLLDGIEKRHLLRMGIIENYDDPDLREAAEQWALMKRREELDEVLEKADDAALYE